MAGRHCVDRRNPERWTVSEGLQIWKRIVTVWMEKSLPSSHHLTVFHQAVVRMLSDPQRMMQVWGAPSVQGLSFRQEALPVTVPLVRSGPLVPQVFLSSAERTVDLLIRTQ
ncbi:MAG: hypothetical protein JNL58_09725 [Planctomyces sp.]|nr:hypothetical protein [Planctomyces sp.]